jgi:hypothetical protein
MATNRDKQHSHLADSIMYARTIGYNLWFTLCNGPVVTGHRVMHHQGLKQNKKEKREGKIIGGRHV